MKHIKQLAIILALGMFGWLPAAFAQQPAKPKAAPSPAPTSSPSSPSQNPPNQADAAAGPGWIARCTSTSRSAPPECAAEETAILTKTGQVIVVVNVRVPSDTHAPVALVQLPLGLNLPSGAKLQIDDGKVIDLEIQTCENKGCYATTPIAPDMLAMMRSGKQLKVQFQNLNKESIAIPLPLADFASAYDKIK
jgi:invasion protein IalB